MEDFNVAIMSLQQPNDNWHCRYCIFDLSHAIFSVYAYDHIKFSFTSCNAHSSVLLSALSFGKAVGGFLCGRKKSKARKRKQLNLSGPL